MPYKKKSSKRTIKGGVIVEGVSAETFPIYRECSKNDCVRSAFFELGMYGTSASDPKHDFIARCFPDGIPLWEIIPILNYAYRIEHIPMSYRISDDTIDYSIDDLSSRLRNGDAVLAFRNFHMFIVFKEKDELFVRNPQAHSIKPIKDYLDTIKEKKINEFGVIFTEKNDRVPLKSHEALAKITPRLIQELASMGLLPSYKYKVDERSGWSMTGKRKNNGITPNNRTLKQIRK